jgi:hypothetical protein
LRSAGIPPTTLFALMNRLGHPPPMLRTFESGRVSCWTYVE